MARILPVLAALALLASGCLGAEGRQAQTLLEQSQAATSQVRSLSFQADITFTADGRTETMTMDGAGTFAHGKPVAQVIHVSGAGATGTMLVRNGRTWVEQDGRWTTAGPVPAGGATTLGPETFEKLAGAIKDVHVQAGQTIGGEPSATVTATIDTGKLLKSSIDSNGLKGLGLDHAFDEIAKARDDMNVVLVFSERTHLLEAGMITLGFHAEGHEATMQLGFRITGVNGPVEIPPAP